jgi:oxygen-dependent protoporphyrinogen oxidase
MAKIIIVGAGISGLSTAWFLHQQGHHVEVLEQNDKVGGSIQTFLDQGFLVDCGPNSILDRDDKVRSLAEAVGMGLEISEANPAAKTRFIAKNGQLMPLPLSPGAFIKTPLFSLSGKLRLLLEPLKTRAIEEETVAQFVRRRLGQDFLDWAIDPFVSGVYAGDPNRLSVRAATAKIYALEAEYGSLFIGAIRHMQQHRASGPTPQGRLISFRQGMHSLPATITRALGDVVKTGHKVTQLELKSTGDWRVKSGQGEHDADKVVLALPAHPCAKLVNTLDTDMTHALMDIPYAAVASVALGFKRLQVGHPLDGFGVLLPSRLGMQTLGALFSSTLFGYRAPQDHVLLTAFIGGARNPAIIERSQNEITGRVLQNLRHLLHISGKPVFHSVTLWPKAIPQYELGHLERIQRVDSALKNLPGLYVRANWRDGISLADCVANAAELANTINNVKSPGFQFT